ncbi:MAG: site-specific integrase [Erysipelotrichaceae bacterium]
MDHSRTCQIILLTLKQIFEQAIDDEIIIRNPCRAVARPRYRKPKKRALTRDEIKMINSAQLTLRERMYVNMLYYFGLRREEALALTKKDFNLRSNVLSINKALVFISNKGVIKDTKSVSSDRVISIQSTIKPFIREYLKHLDGDYLFTSLIDKQLITESSFKKMWKSIMTKFDDAADELCLDQIDGLSSHTFRHNYATMLHSAGVSVKEAQYLLGHSNSSITMDIYTHLDGANLQADNKLSEYLKSIEK